jgi:sec-independent protein translocase protein TatB
MFDFGFGELLLLAVIALVVLGPERLPVAARLLGRWIRAARSQWNTVKAELENEIADEELRRSLREASDALHDGANEMRALVEPTADPPPAPDAPATQPKRQPLRPREDDAPAAVSDAPPETAAAQARAADEPAQLSLLAPDSANANPASSPARTRSDG